MRIRVLGSAAGGGLPQWNCACAVCREARIEGNVRRQDTVAISGDGIAWYLINAAPDVRAGILSTPELMPGPGPRDTPLRGVLLTTAELDHTLGLLSLREAVRLSVYATATVTGALTRAFPILPTLGRYTCLTTNDLSDLVTLEGGLQVQRLTVGSRRPRYTDDSASAGDQGDGRAAPGRSRGAPVDAGQTGRARSARRSGDAGPGDWVSALRITDLGTKEVFVYATCLPEWTTSFDAFVDGADDVLLDGTFGTEDELTAMTGGPGGARSTGHLPMDVSRRHAARHPGTRFRFSHLNNTNPATGGDIVADGDRF
ncbi:pyrroloquinoline quinone biosynthesis protein PqqB [Actinoplanes sp. NPDC020271]|uniref:pyrroloquinoline quinone biosynthesis protein PqqB n=1 Tax=Actinoplanes sp. NPDC020271 TaxID=3363896 RepID=UPI0037989115